MNFFFFFHCLFYTEKVDLVLIGPRVENGDRGSNKDQETGSQVEEAEDSDFAFLIRQGVESLVRKIAPQSVDNPTH